MKITLSAPDDWHVHLRQGGDLEFYAERSAESFGRVMVMPNTLPPLVDASSVLAYREKIGNAAPLLDVVPVFRLMPGMKEHDIDVLYKAGIETGKYYPDGATTNSGGGIRNWKDIKEALGAMEERNMVLSVHGENPAAPVLEREEAFLPEFREIRKTFRNLRIVLEHVSSAASVREIANSGDNTAATITLHHLLFTLDDMIGGGMNPFLFCKPVVKSAADRDALKERLLAEDQHFFFGSDSAPHKKKAKLSGTAPAGVYSVPGILPALAEWFEENSALDLLEPFLCEYGRKFYRKKRNPGRVVLEKKEWTVPAEMDGCVPLLAGRTLKWQLVDVVKDLQS